VGNRAEDQDREVDKRQITFHEKNMGYFDILAKTLHNFEKPFLWLVRKQSGDATLRFVEEPAPQPPAAKKQYEAASVPPLPEDYDEDF